MSDLSRWTVANSIDLYHIESWATGYFRVNEAGHVEVTPEGPDGPALDLHTLAHQLVDRGIGLPLLLRFPGILESRVEALSGAFDLAIASEGYRGRYHSVYPIKVNQQRQVVEALVGQGSDHPFGLEAGSKPEVLAALALMEDPDALLVLNGYKDDEFVETALLAKKLGRNAVIVVDRYRELDIILRKAEELGIAPRIGVRVQLDAKASGRWSGSSGFGAKFGLEADEMVAAVERLRARDMLDSLVLLHFHVGSQVTAIRGLKDAVQEAARVYVELVGMGARLDYLDVGGGLAVDYDGSRSSSDSSMNYDLQEYANNVVFHVREMCDEKNVPHPNLVTEAGRALVAHHSVLVFDVPDVDQGLNGAIAETVPEGSHRVLHSLYETWESIEGRNIVECWHDVNYTREEAVKLFAGGVIDLEEKARVDNLYRACCRRILEVTRGLPEVPSELEDLERRLCDIYFGNFSVFQSAPDNWAVDQLFPVMPIHRLGERPVRRGIIADLTCDSDGVIDRFIGRPQAKRVLELHAPDGEPYLLGVFLLGAYQEILGDLHNLFGDTNAVHVSLDAEGNPIVEDVVQHDTVSDVLGYVGFARRDLLTRMRRAVEQALRAGRLSLKESALFLKDYESGLAGTTYLEGGAGDDAETPERPAPEEAADHASRPTSVPR